MTAPVAHYGSSRLPGYDAEHIGTRKVLDNFLDGVMQVLSPRSFRRCFHMVLAACATPFTWFLISPVWDLMVKKMRQYGCFNTRFRCQRMDYHQEAALPEEWSCLIGS